MEPVEDAPANGEVESVKEHSKVVEVVMKKPKPKITKDVRSDDRATFNPTYNIPLHKVATSGRHKRFCRRHPDG